jgi:hypothetical protein
MAVRAHWLPTGTETAEDARNGQVAGLVQVGLNTARAGVLPTAASQQPFALTSTGSLSCSVGPGQAIISPGATTSQGSYPVTVDASGGGLPTLTFAAGGSLARTDVIYIQVQDNAEDSSGITAAKVAVVQGTNGGGVPSPPAGTISIWQVPVPANATSINFATAVWVGGYTVAIGGVVPSFSSGYPSATPLGQTRVRLDRSMTAAPGPLEAYDGSAWQTAIPSSYPRGRVAASKITTAGANSSNSTPVVYNTITTTLTSGRRYRLWAAGFVNDNTVGLKATMGLYYIAGSSMPAGASGATLLIANNFGADANSPYQLSEEFVAPSTGTFTVAITYALGSGSGVVAISSGLNQQLWLEDVGI